MVLQSLRPLEKVSFYIPNPSTSIANNTWKQTTVKVQDFLGNKLSQVSRNCLFNEWHKYKKQIVAENRVCNYRKQKETIPIKNMFQWP